MDERLARALNAFKNNQENRSENLDDNAGRFRGGGRRCRGGYPRRPRGNRGYHALSDWRHHEENYGSEDSENAEQYCGATGPLRRGSGRRGGVPSHQYSENDHTKRTTRQTYPLGYRKLEDIVLHEDDSTSVLLELNTSPFKELLQKDDISLDMMCLIFKAILKTADSPNRQSLVSFLTMIGGSDKFMMIHILKYLSKLYTPDAKKKHFLAVADLLEVLKLLQEIIPSVVNSKLSSLPSVKEVAEITKRKYPEIKHDLFKDIQELEDVRNEYLNSCMEKSLRTNSEQESQQVQAPPPNSFRDIPVFPELSDILEPGPPFLRANIVHGKYDDIEHYLDVQFRLLREDFVQPLRLGIQEYLRLRSKRESVKRLREIRVYSDVHIDHPVCSSNALFHQISFGLSGLKSIRWETSKRFLTGSLLCFSSDDFQSILLGTVVSRNVEKLKEGKLAVSFFDLEKVVTVKPDVTFVMVETSAYFEAYQHNLAVLQTVTSNSFPFQKYIIKADTNPEPPKYLSERTSYNLAPVMNSEVCFKSIILKKESWPSLRHVCMDPSQFQAVQAALTQEFTLIQGPPGTGKTFIGLKIVEVLLKNSHVWYNNSPILVVCYTNHALDQFLEGIIKFTEQVIRVGGRCNSPEMTRFKLNEMRQQKRERKEFSKGLQKSFWEVCQELEEIRRCVIREQSNYERSLKGLLKFNDLKEILSEKVLCFFLEIDSLELGEDVIYSWLDIHGLVMESAARKEDPVEGSRNEHQNETEEEEDYEDEEEDMEYLQGMREIDDEEYNLKDDFVLLNPLEEVEEFITLNECSDGWSIQGGKKKIRKYIEKKIKEEDVMTEAEADSVHNIWRLQVKDRWRLYRYWCNQYSRKKLSDIATYQEEFRQKVLQQKELRDQESFEVLQSALVVGMTTTGAAKCQALLKRLNPKILLVEEAAEVLEAHIVTTLNANTQHLILIGDHQQLRPSATVYELAKKYNLDVSLFERMVKNNMSCQKLLVQHRMRNEFLPLIVPHIYKELESHPSVLDYENIKGVISNIYFVNHSFTETSDDDSKSHSNRHEAAFLVRLCRYLLLQGYDSSQITVLTAYSGQMFLLKKLMREDVTNNVRVTVVDNFQGEENDIILLSFVRSNEEGKIGFLKTENRVCVALSRAKKGLYCIGNFEFLQEKSGLWSTITKTLRRQNAIGNKLTLRCRNHPETYTEVSTAKDFDRVPEGGCTKPCIVRLPCGHSCPRVCHTYELDHENKKCTKSCSRDICLNKHKCPLKCYEKCMPCRTNVLKMLPCGHKTDVPCSILPENFKCNEPCQIFKSCGHQCQAKCSEICPDRCYVPVKVDSLCGHTVAIACYFSKNTTEILKRCNDPCRSQLQCEHWCKGSCGKCHQGRLHVKCQEACGRILVCGHPCKEPCANSCTTCALECENLCVHSKCRNRCGEPCMPCKEKCAWNCKHHKCDLLCSEPCTREPCGKPCPRKLEKCGHECAGFCGEPCPELCRVCDKGKLTEILFGSEDDEDARFIQLEDCGHVLEASGLQTWMEMEAKEIQLKSCPRCKTAIRRNLRFGNVVRKCLNDIENVKLKLFGKVDEIRKKTKDLETQLLGIHFNNDAMGSLKNRLRSTLESKTISLQVLTQLENFVNFLKRLTDVESILTEMKKVASPDTSRTTFPGKEWLEKNKVAVNMFYMFFSSVVSFIGEIYNSASEHQIKDIHQEIQRLECVCSFYKIIRESSYSTEKDEVRNLMAELFEILSELSCFTEECRQTCLYMKNKIIKLKGAVINVSDDEKHQILKAMNLAQGHWYQCPNGHVYCITECGGANEVGRCNECGAKIGGADHALLNTNRVATDMDGARHGAWSEYQNMQNYHLLREDLFD